MNFLIPDKKLTDNLSNNSPNLSNGLSDNEIKKALECCVNNTNEDCNKCVCSGSNVSCVDVLLTNALDLINRLQAENKRLSTLAKLGNTRANDYRVMRDRALKAEAENERLQDHIKEGIDLAKQLPEMVSLAKAEAYKEYHIKAKACLKANRDVEQQCGNYYAASAIKDIENRFDNLLKELVGDNK